MMKQYMKIKVFLQKEELLSRIAELFSKKILRSSGVLVFLLITCLGLFSCSKFLEENPKDKLPEDDVLQYNLGSISQCSSFALYIRRRL